MRLRALATALAGAVAATGAARAQQGSAERAGHRETIWMAYDSASGYSTVELRPMRVAEWPSIHLATMAVAKGDRFAKPPTHLSIALIVESAGARFADDRDLAFTVDGVVRWRASGRDVVRTVDTAAGRVSERLAARISTATLRQIVGGERVAGRVSTAVFVLAPDKLEALRDFAGRLSPEGHERALVSATAAASVRGLAVRKEWYEQDEVDRRAEPATLPVRPAFPDVPPEEQRQREFWVEVLVDTAGRVTLVGARSQSVGVVKPFVESLESAITRWEYTPAIKDGRPVKQIIRQVIVFEPKREEHGVRSEQ